MPLPTAAELTDPTATNTQMKQRLSQLVENVESRDGATAKANTAKSEAISAAATDATNKANTAKSEAISAAATDATNKANTAKSEAISAAATDATNKASAAESNAKSYSNSIYTNLVADNILIPARIKITDTALSGRINKAIKSLSLRGDYNSKLITLAAMSYVNNVFTIHIARPDALNEVMSSTSNTKFVARFSGNITFSGTQTLQLTTLANEISGQIVIDFSELLTTDALTANYTANERLFDSRSIINLNADYTRLLGIDTAIATNNTKIDRNKGIIFTDDASAATAIYVRLNKAIKSLSLRGDYNSKLITLAAMSYVNNVFTIHIARPDALNEVMSSTSNTKFVARFSGNITFSGTQTLQLTTLANEISGQIVIDFSELLTTDALTANYTANERLFDSRSIINLNADYTRLLGIDTAIATNNTKIDRNKGIIFTDDASAATAIYVRLNKAIKSLALRGDFNGKLITLSNMSYSGGVFTIQFARPDALDEVMSATTNTKFVARFQSVITFSGVQKLQLNSFGNTSADISGEIVIDFGELLTSDALTADYVASSRLFDMRKINDINGAYTKIKAIDAAIATNADSIMENKVEIDHNKLVYGTDAKNTKINDAIEELVFFKPLPKDKFLILKGLYYTRPTMALYIYVADDAVSQGTLWAYGEGIIDTVNNKVLIILDQGYATVNLDYYYAQNGATNGAALVTDNATFQMRGINQYKIEKSTLYPKLFTRYENQYVANSAYQISTDLWQRSVKLFINGVINDTDYYLITSLFWNIVNSKYRLNYQIKKMTTTTQDVSGGLIVYAGNFEFTNLTDIKGTQTLKATQVNGHKLEALLELNFDNLQFRNVDYNTLYTPYFLNKTDFTYEKYGFDIAKLRKSSKEKFAVTSSIIKYPSLKYALDVKEKNLFAVGCNLFKSRVAVPVSKDDFLCVNNPAKLLAKKPRKQEYDFYYKTAKIRLDSIDSDDTFYFANSNVIIKTQHPLKQSLTQVAAINAADFVLFDVKANAYFAINNFTELFTKNTLSVASISFVQLTYDGELFIAAKSVALNQIILMTQNNQSSLRNFTINGMSSDRYEYGQGVIVVKDWCLAHDKNVMFICDYDSGVNGIRGTTGGQKCYVSLDNGYTFTKSLDFSGSDWSNVINASAITSFNRDAAHIHAVSYDAKQKVAWIVTGDGAVYADNTSFFYSRDLGQTWTQMRSITIDANRKMQMIKALPFDGCVAFGSDDDSINGATVVTYDDDRMIYESMKNFVATEQLLSFARGTWNSNHSNIKYISFGKDVQQIGVTGSKSFVIASSNGYTWENIWEDASDQIYSSVYCYDDKNGKVFISLDGVGSNSMRVVALDVKYI